MTRSICIIFLLNLLSISLYAAPEDYKRGHASPTAIFDHEMNIVFECIDFPLEDITDTFTKSIFSKIDTAYGIRGLNLNARQIILIKKTYLYLIFLTKLEKIKINPTLKKYQSAFLEYMIDNNQQLPHFPSKKLVTSNDWNAVIVSENDLQQSTAWQLFCKTMIANSYITFYTALNITHNVECQTFNYIPHIETSYYDQDFTNLRYINEMMRLKFILEQTNLKFYLQQCNDWNVLPQINHKEENQNKKETLEQAIVNFKKTPFYIYTHNIHALLGIKDPKATNINQQMIAPVKLSSPLKEQIWCFFMLQEIATLFYGQMNTPKLANVLKFCSQSNLIPNVFAYNLNDYAYYDELLAIKSIAEENHNNSIHPSPKRHRIEDVHLPSAHDKEQKLATHKNLIQQTTSPKDAIVQWWPWSEIKHAATSIAHAVVHGVEDVGDTITDAYHAAYKATESVVHGTLGLSANILGTIVDSSTLKKFGSKEEQYALQDLQTASQDLQKSITDIGNVTKAGYEIYASINASLLSIITDDQKLGDDLETITNSVYDGLIDVAEQYQNLMDQYTVNAAYSMLNITDKFASLVANSALAIFTAGQYGTNQWLENATGLLNTTVQSITESFSNLISASKAVLAAVMQCLGAITNSLTTMFIDISREITFIAVAGANLTGTVFTEKFDFKDAITNAEQTRNMVTSTLNAHRQTINQVMGVAVAVAFTVGTIFATAGTGTGLAVAGDTALISGEATAAAVGEAGAAAVGEAAGEAVGETVGETVAEETAEKVAEETAEKVAEETTEKVAEETTEKVAEDAAKKAAKFTLKRVFFTALHFLGQAMNLVFSVFAIMSGINSDSQNAFQEQQETEQLINTWELINNNKIFLIQRQSSYLEELQEKLRATIANQTLGLSFIKNITNASVNQMTQQLSVILTEQLLPMLMPDQNNMLAADIGTSWGIESSVLNLYPTEGYATVTTGRTDFPFAQEVAQTPYTGSVLTQSSKSLNHTKQPAKMWFNQKVTALDNTYENGTAKKPTDPLNVEIALQFLYTIKGPFYVGLYLGGDYYNYPSANYLQKAKNYITQLQSEGLSSTAYNQKLSEYIKSLNSDDRFNIDYAHLAKMVVIFRPTAKAPLQIGVYENEGKNWILQGEVLPKTMQFNIPHTYHMQTNLNKEQLEISIWVDNDTANIWKKTVEVTSLENQRTFGVISSGAAIQWNQISPKPSLIVNRQARPTSKQISEIAREKQSKLKLSSFQQPTFGPIKLQSISKTEVLFGHYLYTTRDTNLQKINPSILYDYVIFATNQNGNITNLGAAPDFSNSQNSANAMVSVISGNVYNNKGEVISHAGNVWNSYNQTFGPFDKNINSYITKTQQQITTQLAHIKFGSFQLDALNQTALTNGQFIYTSPQTIELKNAQGQPILDYLVIAEINNNQLGTNIGMPPTASNAQGLLSLITGNLFDKNTVITPNKAPTPLATGYAQLTNYEQSFNLSAADATIIQNAITAYFTALKAANQQAAAKKTPHFIIFSSKPASSSSMAPLSTGINLGQGPGAISLGNQPTGNISNLQQQAAGPAGISLQLGTPSGPQVNLGTPP